MADTSTDKPFTGGMSKLGTNFDNLTPDQKVAAYKSTTDTEATVADLALISPFTARMYYED